MNEVEDMRILGRQDHQFALFFDNEQVNLVSQHGEIHCPVLLTSIRQAAWVWRGESIIGFCVSVLFNFEGDYWWGQQHEGDPEVWCRKITDADELEWVESADECDKVEMIKGLVKEVNGYVGRMARVRELSLEMTGL